MFLVLKLYPIQVFISVALWTKLTMGQLVLFFLCNFCNFVSYIRAVLVNNLFPLLLIDRYILTIQQFITHKKHFWYTFWSAAISELPQKRWYHSYNNRKWLKQSQSHFTKRKSHNFLLFCYILGTASPDNLASSKNINNTAIGVC